jgi:O-antigen ligase
MAALQQQVGEITSWLLIFLAFCLPLSTSVVTILALLIFVCWIIEGGYRQKWREIRTNPVCLAVFIYLGVYLIGICWTDDLSEGIAVLMKQWKLMLLPVFLTTVRWQRRWWYVGAYIAGVSCVMLLVYLVASGAILYDEVDARGHLTLIGNQIVYTPMLALAIYLLMHQVLWSEARGWQQWSMSLLAGFMTVCVFITKGRAGQMVFFLLMIVLIFQFFRRSLLNGALLTFFLLPLVFTVAYHVSPVFQERVDRVPKEITMFEKNYNTSVGQRLLYWKNSWEVIKQSPWLGTGTGGFKSSYAQVNLHRSPDMPPTANPHNQYIFVAVQLGVFGLLGLIALFSIEIMQAWRTNDGWQRIRLAFPLFFLVIMITDTYLDTHNSGFLFSLFSAVFYKNNMLLTG